jgi:hypothetical protein
MTWATLLRITVFIPIAFASFFMNEQGIINNAESVISQAHARIGRPATALSYAGVARRTTRRAVAVGATVAPVVVAPTCVQAVDAYGRIYTRCY